MNEIININLNDNQEPVVSGRQLHEALEVKTPYSMWFDRMVEYGFSENQDFLLNNFVKQTGRGGHNKVDHIIKLDMAKEIAMIQRTERGKQVRQYFIQVEKDFNSPEKIMARALLLADKKVHQLEAQIEADKPKVLFANAVEASATSILIGDFAKILRQNGYNIGQNRLFEWLRENGFLIRKRGESYNMPTQRSMDMSLFEVKERTHHEPNGSIRISKTTKMTGKGQTYFINKFLNQAGAS
ncbi:TPA: phage antirepressor KilAC domain-containing protein [Streptococcus suis 11538]|uniref:phage antirepressor KilAC domain-containing protein n=1 Tax=Streptococcus suis TaxID=1307 RepID=UPI00042159AB|nr:phage antirepressor KilAC domain-containing protein [Streptococcus suis]HEL2310496.1 phage antirepressor KilAC domain-containing protein [Streptococcus suis]HEL2620138.1 phage antirepressor KilAC domain-containing protein [Streptococcus suis]HEL2654309.1 phage antirepressor KilAC domain-containing protein [Streptococcus suis]HEM2587605.1 phage antirepressor KilAC domain-containing protein [Streptococcus suis]HEM2715311.1 phage antirepressor KilAC domain-containing protein [Streptococcus sui